MCITYILATDVNLTALNYKIITTLAKTAKAADIAMDIANDLESNIETRVKQISTVNTEDISMANASGIGIFLSFWY